ncbi:hypothetical protein DLJ53_16100 [Acuticoccus sediminis]|uniref:Phage integrase family protein n=1 Tax=Acuticoccus sediminis TaxID=2184697 RepID=A0A8B2NM63_9HYPH|nr:hypothetical protein DLJ53_16100 [Acuticoccus sediminis]
MEQLQKIINDRIAFMLGQQALRSIMLQSENEALRAEADALRAEVERLRRPAEDQKGSLHGLRKAGARQWAESGATENEVASFLAHRGTRTASTYTREADRQRLSDSGWEKVKAATNLAQPSKKVGRTGGETP